MKIKLIALLALIGIAGCSPGAPSGTMAQTASKVCVIAVGGLSWSDITGSSAPNLNRLIREGSLANVAVRVTNRPADAYATLGAGQRIQTIPSAGWAFDSGEIVENGLASDLHERRTGRTADAEVVVPFVEQIVRANVGRAFDGRPGALAETIGRVGKTTAVIGNSDHSAGPLPRVLVDQTVMALSDAPETGIHREGALVTMEPSGVVEVGRVGRDLLVPDGRAAAGVRSDIDKYIEAFERSWATSDVVVVDIGDTARADRMSSAGRAERDTVMDLAISTADEIIGSILERIDLDSSLLLVIAPTTPGGPEARGRLRPAILTGAGLPPGLLVSGSTTRVGIITMPDLTATIAHSIGASDERFGAGRAVLSVPTQDPLTEVVSRDRISVHHDRARLAFAALATLILAAAAIWGRRRPLLIVTAALVPASSYVTKLSEVDVHPYLTAAGTVIVALVVAASLLASFRRNTASCFKAAALLTFLVMTIDLATGSWAQLDSFLGYTSVAAGRFFGLGNLGFAVLGSFALGICAFAPASSHPWAWWSAIGVALVTLVWTGHPALGDDVGGTLAFAPAATVLLLSRKKPIRVGPRALIAVGLAAILALTVFGLADLSRPPSSRTHLGDLIAQSMDDPTHLWLVIRRKITLLVSTGLLTWWGALVIPAGWRLLNPRGTRAPWLRNAVTAMVALAAIGSALNDSGLAVGGMVLAIAVLLDLSFQSPEPLPTT